MSIMSRNLESYSLVSAYNLKSPLLDPAYSSQVAFLPLPVFSAVVRRVTRGESKRRRAVVSRLHTRAYLYPQQSPSFFPTYSSSSSGPSSLHLSYVRVLPREHHSSAGNTGSLKILALWQQFWWIVHSDWDGEVPLRLRRPVIGSPPTPTTT